jgi:hypothetical protein
MRTRGPAATAGDGVVEPVMFLGQGIELVEREEAVCHGTVERDGGRSFLLNRKEFRAHNGNDAALFDEGQQIVPEFLDFEGRHLGCGPLYSLRARMGVGRGIPAPSAEAEISLQVLKACD